MIIKQKKKFSLLIQITTMKKLLLINPVGRRSGYMLSSISRFPPLNLAYVAAVTPSNWQIKIVDENLEEFEFEDADLVGITAFSSNINRAYEIASVFRKKGIKVILGGIHASMFQDEAVKYVDTVVTGEVESIWETIVNDFEKGNLLSVYTGDKIDFRKTNITPRRDLLHPEYFWQPVQTSRGCPFNCSFCSVTRYLGSEYRLRSPEDVLKELVGIKGQYITFVDDNLVGYSEESRNRAKEIFRGMIEKKLNKKWWMQTSINASDDEEVVKLAAEAGCMFVFIGFETISNSTLEQMKKGINLKTGVDNYKKVVAKFHKYGISVLGAFILGNDYESSIYYKELADFLLESGVDIFQISILTPLPGTRLMEELKDEGRIIYEDFPVDWDKYRFSYMVHEPKGLDADTVYIGDNYIKNKLYSFPFYQYRLFKSFLNLKKIKNFYVTYKLNKALKRSWRNSHYYKKYPSVF